MLVINFEDVLFYIPKNHFLFGISDIIKECKVHFRLTVMAMSHFLINPEQGIQNTLMGADKVANFPRGHR